MCVDVHPKHMINISSDMHSMMAWADWHEACTEWFADPFLLSYQAPVAVCHPFYHCPLQLEIEPCLPPHASIIHDTSIFIYFYVRPVFISTLAIPGSAFSSQPFPRPIGSVGPAWSWPLCQACRCRPPPRCTLQVPEAPAQGGSFNATQGKWCPMAMLAKLVCTVTPIPEIS